MTEQELMKDFDGAKYEGRYCDKIGCNACKGTDYNGEPNGYGCEGEYQYINKRYQSILKRRIKRHSLTHGVTDTTRG